MSKILVKSGDLTINGIYLQVGNKPVFHKEFVAAQKRAEWVITFANMAKDKDFNGKEGYSLNQLKSDVNSFLAKKATKYVNTIEVEIGDITKKLQQETLAWHNANKTNSIVEKVNNFLQEFDIINKFEQVGLYFEEDVCELNKIYTMEEIVIAVTSVINLL